MAKALADRSQSWSQVRKALRGAQKSNRNAPAYSRWLNRPLGGLLATSAFKLGLTPNQVTGISAVFTFGGLALLATTSPTWLHGLVVAALLALGYALDSADGQLARLRGGGSPAGEWLDHVIDATKQASLHLVVAVLWFRHLDGWPVWTVLVPLGFSVVACVWFFTMILTDQLERAAGTKRAGAVAQQPHSSLLNSVIATGLDYGFQVVTMLLLGFWTGWRWLYTVLAVFNLLMLLAQLVRWYRRVDALPRP